MINSIDLVYAERTEKETVIKAETIWSSSKLYRVSRFFDGGPKEERVVFVLKVKSGIDLANHNGTETVNFGADFPREVAAHEVLILPQTEFKVVNILKSKDPAIQLVIVLEEK